MLHPRDATASVIINLRDCFSYQTNRQWCVMTVFSQLYYGYNGKFLQPALLKVFGTSPNATKMVRNSVQVAITAPLMSADEVIAVMNLETELSLEPRDAECEMISWLCRTPPVETLCPRSRSVCP